MVLALACNGERASADAPQKKKEVGAPVARAPTPAPEGGIPFSAEDAAPWFRNGKAAEAAERFVLDDHAGAGPLFQAALRAKDLHDPGVRARLSLLVSLCDLALGNAAEAARRLEELVPALPHLQDFVRYQAARAHYLARDLTRAMKRAAEVAPTSIFSAEARLLQGDVLRAQGKWTEVAKHYRAYLDDLPGGMRRVEARFRLAEALERQGKPLEALQHYRAITIDAPLDGWASDAKARFDALMARLPKAKREPLMILRAAELLRRVKVYFDHMRNPESEADFAAGLAAPGLDPDLECQLRYHRAQSVFKQRQRARSAPFFEEAMTACARTRDQDLQVRSAYQAGRAYTHVAGEEGMRKAIALFEKAETWHPEHSFADDARLRQAEVWKDLADKGAAGAEAKVTELLSALPDRYPTGDMKAEALWRLAWRDYKAQRYQAALTWLDKQIATVPIDENYWAEGQAQYWKGRSFDRLRRPAEALTAYQACVRAYPLSYYALLALNRIRERDRALFDRLTAELKRAPPDRKEGAATFEFTPRAVYGEPGFRRAIEFLKLGLGSEAERELARLGLKVPPGKAKVTDPAQAELLWATALLYDRARRYDKSHWIARWAVLDYKRTWPTSANRARWEIAYPRAWWHVLEPASKVQGYPPELLISFVREESAFTPTLESFANAIGLTQMIFPTARRFGKGLGFSITRENLRDPEKNVAIGSRFLAFLVQTFEGRIGLIMPAYNAGEGAVWKWLCVRGDWAQDEWSEEIPYDETRNYSKRVINSYFVYTWLRDGTVPEVPNEIPRKVRNEKKCAGLEPARQELADKPDK
jgi:soluble lytic murein transglycosylase